MGWFWADVPVRASVPVAPHPVPDPTASPPPGCPMHVPETTPPSFPPRLDNKSDAPTSCPVQSPSHPLRFPTLTPSPQARSNETQSKSPQPLPQSMLSKLNPLNYMPNLSNRREYSEQTTQLPLERETSSIPRGDAESNWEYPSPQQMYNAMLRKGYTDTPVEHVESMVAVHNFLNEGAWNEIVEWENIFSHGLKQGWERCRKGEEGLAMEKAKRDFLRQRREALASWSSRNPATPSSSSARQPTSPSAAAAAPGYPEEKQPKLLRFQGRPDTPTPKSRILTTLGQFFPNTFSSEPPFDRHDWFIARTTPTGSTKEIRYVIDYYGAGLQETGEPVFYLDIRPALDTPTAAAERLCRWGGDVWWRASGGSVREQKKAVSGAVSSSS